MIHLIFMMTLIVCSYNAINVITQITQIIVQTMGNPTINSLPSPSFVSHLQLPAMRFHNIIKSLNHDSYDFLDCHDCYAKESHQSIGNL